MKEDAKIAEICNSFFGDIVNILNTDKGIFCDTGNETDPLLRAIKKHSKHPSILTMKDKDVTAKEIKNLDTEKAVPQDDILVNILKLNNDIFSQFLYFLSYRKGYSFQHSLIKIFENWKKNLDKEGGMWCFIRRFIYY